MRCHVELPVTSWKSESDNTKCNTPAPHSHLRPCDTNESHDTGERKIGLLVPIWTFSLRGVLTFVSSGLDINGCVLSYFEGTVNLHRYTSCTLNTLHCSKVSFLQCCHMKRYNQIFKKMWGVYSSPFQESLQILQIPSSLTVLLLFSSPTHFLQGSGQRTGMAIAEAFLCCFLGLFLDYCTIGRSKHAPLFLTVSHLLIFYLLVVDRISDAMCPNKMSRTWPMTFSDLQQKYRPTTSKIQQYISLYTWGTCYPCVHQMHLECLLLKSSFF